MQKGYLDSIPTELDEAALIDGASRMRTFLRVILPPSMPGMVATTLFGFLLAGGDPLWAATLASTDDVRTVTQGIAFAVGESTPPGGLRPATATAPAASAPGSPPSRGRGHRTGQAGLPPGNPAVYDELRRWPAPGRDGISPGRHQAQRR